MCTYSGWPEVFVLLHTWKKASCTVGLTRGLWLGVVCTQSHSTTQRSRSPIAKSLIRATERDGPCCAEIDGRVDREELCSRMSESGRAGEQLCIDSIYIENWTGVFSCGEMALTGSCMVYCM